MLEKYRLKDGSIYWHKLYFSLVPKWTTKYSPPLGTYNYAAYLYRPHRYVMDLYDRAKWFVQRGYRGYSDCDVWGWSSHHSRMMVGVLEQLIIHGHGYPIGLSPAKWDKKLQVMQEGFQAAVDEEDDMTSYKKLSRQAYLGLMRTRRRKLDLALKYFRKYYQNLWD
jgi:hypothetical protein